MEEIKEIMGGLPPTEEFKFLNYLKANSGKTAVYYSKTTPAILSGIEFKSDKDSGENDFALWTKSYQTFTKFPLELFQPKFDCPKADADQQKAFERILELLLKLIIG